MATLTFAQLNLAPELLTAVEEMGFTEATDIQAEAIPLICGGADVLARSQTGTGKTVAFGIPAVSCISPEIAKVQVLVLSPTRELANQCGNELRKLSRHLPHVRTADILGGNDYREQFKQLQSANLVIGTPGRIMDHMRRGTLDLSHLKMVVLDEADEMLNMGFREDIEVILQDVPEQRQIVLFSATMPPEILSIAKNFQHDPVRVEINRGQITLQNIKQIYAEVPQSKKVEALNLLLHYYRPTRTIIFANTKTMVDKLTEKLSATGFSVVGLHGDMKQLQRTTVMNGFRNGRVSILVATDVAARGIDVSDIEYVVNFDIPKETEAYVHRIGRTGRAGQSGQALTLCCGRQQVFQLLRICQRTRSDITRIDMPTVSDVAEADRGRTLQVIEQEIAAQPAPLYEQMVEQLVEKGYGEKTIAAALMSLYAVRGADDLTDVPAVSSGVSKPERTRIRKATLLIDIGASNRVSEKHIIGAVTERAGISSHAIEEVRVSEESSSLVLPLEQADSVIVAMQGCKICGKPVHVAMQVEQNRSRPKNAGRPGAPRRPGKPYAKKGYTHSKQGKRR